MVISRLLIGLCLIIGSVSSRKTTTSDGVVSDSSLDNEASTNKIVNTDVDTRGDIIITGDPITEIEDATSATELNVTVEISSTTLLVLPTTTEAVTTTERVPVSPCSSNPCQHGGMCQEHPTPSVAYCCNCTKGYTGTHCQVSDYCAVDDKGNVCSKGACAYDKDGGSRSCKCFFGMYWEDALKECRDSHPPCLPNPCQNGGTCSTGGDGTFRCSCKKGYEGSDCSIPNWCMEGDYCENGVCTLDVGKGIKMCKCNTGFFWNKNIWECDDPEPPCFPNPCKNNGICTPLPDSPDTFKCDCVPGYISTLCAVEDVCTPFGDGELCENGVCETTQDSRRCVCNRGFYLDGATQTCKDISPCLPNPCRHDGICSPLSEDDFNCTCSDGYVGNLCQDLDYCVLEGGNGFCGEAECWNDPQLKLFYCSCDEMQYFDYASRTCLDIDFCPLMKCGENEVCEKSACKCDEDFERNNITGKCEPNFCIYDACPVKDLICAQDAGSMDYQCSCEKGHAFNGTHCNDGANCVFPNLNSCNQVCTISEKKTICSCVEEFFAMGDDNKTCSPLNNNITCENKTCFRGVCVVKGDLEMCICPPGFTEMDGLCTDLCSAGILPKGYCPNDLCETTSTGFRCKCEGNFILSDDRTTCTVRQVCQKEEIGWSTCNALNAECIEDWNTAEGYRCECLDNQVRTHGGSCHDACSDAENQKMCSALNAVCDNSKGGVTCKCPPFFQPFQEGRVCRKPAATSYVLSLPLNSEAYRRENVFSSRQIRSTETTYEVDLIKAQKDVTAMLNALFPGLLQSHILDCRENKNYILCKIEMQFSSVSTEDLKRLKLSDNCLTVKDSISRCLLPPSLILQRMFVDDIVTYKVSDPCDSDIKDHLCGSDTICASSLTSQSFNCTCKEGFSPRNREFPFGDTESYIESCIDVDECLDRHACPQHMLCRNTLGSYMCSCKARYMLKDTANPNSGCVEICNPNPCLHGQCSSVGDHDFECSCKAGYSGLLCNLRDEHFKKMWTNTVVVGAVLGGALLITIILSIVYTSRLKKRKYSDGPERMLYGTEMTERRNVDSGTINNAFQK